MESKSTMRFDGQVAIVTGAATPLGQSHARQLALRGAKVLVNDYEDILNTRCGKQSILDELVETVAGDGGTAVACQFDVTDSRQVGSMVSQAMGSWGRVDVLVDSSEILRKRSFHKAAVGDFQSVFDTHLISAVNCIRGVWDVMQAQNYGRVVITTSPSGVYGDYDQTNLAVAKAGLVGLMRALEEQAAKSHIHINSLVPVAANPVMEMVVGKEISSKLTPESISPAVLFLASQQAPNGSIISAGAGAFARIRVYETQGVHLCEDMMTPEAVAAQWDLISNPDEQVEMKSAWQQAKKFANAVSLTDATRVSS